MLLVNGGHKKPQLTTVVGCEPRKLPGIDLDTCMTDFMDGNSGKDKKHPCWGCPIGSRRRAEYGGDGEAPEEIPAPPPKKEKKPKLTLVVTQKAEPDPIADRALLGKLLEDPEFRDCLDHIFDDFFDPPKRRRRR